MKIIKYEDLGSDFYDYIEPDTVITEIIEAVKNKGDQALFDLTERYDGVQMNSFKYNLNKNIKMPDSDLYQALLDSAKNIRKFAEKQLSQINDFTIQIEEGVFAGQRVNPIERIGVYVPGGNYPLVSSLLMCAIPARVAGVKNITVTTPPSKDGTIPDIIIAAAKIAGVDNIYPVGGAQAIAALAYGTETISPVDKIVGPGNSYVTAAKREVYGKVGIDFLAGPTEVLIIGDKDADPSIIAADLLAQAEHDPNAVPVLLTDSKNLSKRVIFEINKQIKELKTAGIAEQSINNNGKIIVCETFDQIIEVSNKKAPEHLEIQVKNLEPYIQKLTNFGTLFIGEYAAEALGDYSSGLNHTLPTNRSARYTGGLSVFDFIKISTSLEVSPKGLMMIGPGAEQIAAIEGLKGHKASISKRIKKISDC